MIENLIKLGKEITCLNIIETIYDSPIANITLNDEKLKAFFSKTTSKTKMPALTTFIHHSTGSPSHSN